MTDKIDFTPNYGPRENASIIKVIGVGGGGSNAVEHMYSEGIVGVDFLVCNTDRGHLEKSPVPDKLMLGSGLGAGAKPEVARQYAIEGKDKIMEFIGKETKMLFITAGMGKGTGTGASPVIAQVAREMGILTVGVVTAPFKFEGLNANKQAANGIAEISKYVDSIIVVKNQNILKYYQDDTLDKAYGYADDVLKNAVKCIAELITVNYEQNVDFNDVRSIMQNSGKSMLGLATASGPDRVERVVDDALSCPLLDNSIVKNAQNFLFFISYGPDEQLKISELEAITERFENITSDDAQVIWGRGLDPTLGDQIKLSVIVTNFNDAQKVVEHKIEKESEDNGYYDNGEQNSEITITDSRVGNVQKTPAFQEPIYVNPSSSDFNVPNDIDEIIGGNSSFAPVQGTQNVYDLTSGVQVATPTKVDFAQQRPHAPVQENPQMVMQQRPQQPVRDMNVQPSMPQNFAPVGPREIMEAQRDTLFPTEKDYLESQSTPAIYRQQVMSQGQTAATNTMAMTMEDSHRYYEKRTFDNFFVDLAD